MHGATDRGNVVLTADRELPLRPRVLNAGSCWSAQGGHLTVAVIAQRPLRVVRQDHVGQINGLAVALWKGMAGIHILELMNASGRKAGGQLGIGAKAQLDLIGLSVGSGIVEVAYPGSAERGDASGQLRTARLVGSQGGSKGHGVGNVRNSQRRRKHISIGIGDAAQNKVLAAGGGLGRTWKSIAGISNAGAVIVAEAAAILSAIAAGDDYVVRETIVIGAEHLNRVAAGVHGFQGSRQAMTGPIPGYKRIGRGDRIIGKLPVSPYFFVDSGEPETGGADKQWTLAARSCSLASACRGGLPLVLTYRGNAGISYPRFGIDHKVVVDSQLAALRHIHWDWNMDGQIAIHQVDGIRTTYGIGALRRKSVLQVGLCLRKRGNTAAHQQQSQRKQRRQH